MASSGHFTSRNQIIQWVSKIAGVQLTRIEQLGSGNIYCQLLDAAYPQKVPLSKVKWQAFLEVDFHHNFKILQTSFQRLGINKEIDIQKLSKAKYQDNLEFIQWLNRHVVDKISNDYDPQSRRNHAKVYLLFTQRPVIKTKINKENVGGESQPLKTQRSMQSLGLNGNTCLKTLKKATSFGKLAEQMTSKQKPLLFRKRKLEVTLKAEPLKDKTNVIEEQEECF